MLAKEGKLRLLASCWSRGSCHDIMWNKSAPSLPLGNSIWDEEVWWQIQKGSSRGGICVCWGLQLTLPGECSLSIPSIQTGPHTHAFHTWFLGTEIFGVKREGRRQMRRGWQLEIKLESVRQKNRKGKKMERPWKEINGQKRPWNKISQG